MYIFFCFCIHNLSLILQFPEAFNVFDDKQTIAFNNFSINSKDVSKFHSAKTGTV